MIPHTIDITPISISPHPEVKVELSHHKRKDNVFEQSKPLVFLLDEPKVSKEETEVKGKKKKQAKPVFTINSASM